MREQPEVSTKDQEVRFTYPLSAFSVIDTKMLLSNLNPMDMFMEE